MTPTVNELRGPDGRPLVADDGTLADDASCGGCYEGDLTELPRATALPVDAYADDDVTVWVESLTGDVAHGRWRVRVVADDGVVRTLAESKDLGVPGNVHAAIATPRPAVYDGRVYFNAAETRGDARDVLGLRPVTHNGPVSHMGYRAVGVSSVGQRTDCFTLTLRATWVFVAG
ncbi:hypothetical protein [Sanguibacter massiliensis]|uniref:hypothetical protein n=1 Tax=Sanguibacter massiliensis TaxID=1973217 RepID=UPI00101ADCE5|nr:hypothetical protein [Sanguibacter massiliensis]